MFQAEFLMQKMAREFNDTFMGIVASTKEEIDINELINSLDKINLDKVSHASKFYKFQEKLSQFKPVILNTINIAAKETEKKKNVLLDLDRETSIAEVYNVTTKLITDISEKQREVIKQILSDSLEKELSYKTIADKIIYNIGLNVQQMQSLQTLENNLIKNNATKEVIKKTIEIKTKKMLKQRAETIAITESANAVSSGRYLIQQQMYEDGDIPANTLQEWLTGSDERNCGICAGLNKKKAKLNEYFTSGSGMQVRSPILHPRCRCIVIINY